MELRKSFKQPQERAAYLRHVRPWVEEDKGTQVDLALADALIAGRHDRVSIMVSFPCTSAAQKSTSLSAPLPSREV